MPGQIFGYLIPENKIAFAIVLFLWFVFSLWLLGLVYSLLRLRENLRQMIGCEDVELLVKARQKHQAGNTKLEHDEVGIFNSFCKEMSIRQEAIVTKHLKHIFQSGWKESRLEVSELINHTANVLFQKNGLLRSVLASFIVLGLLGTLLGLADSLASLSPVLVSGFQKTNEGVTQSLLGLLSHLKSAFAPSIWGVALTTTGVLLYGFYLRFGCNPVKSTLEHLTLTTWVPQLYPTTSQKLIETLQQSEQQMHQSFEAARKVAELAESVQTGIGDFNENLSRANLVTGSLSTAVYEINQAADTISKGFAERLSKFSDEFSGNVSSLTSFQGDLRILYQKMVDESDAFQSAIRQTLNSQNVNLVEIMKTFKNYETAYIVERGQIDAKLQTFLSEATEANTSINAQNRNLVEEIGNQLTKDLQEIKNAVHTGLVSITEKFNGFDVPIRSAAEKIEGSNENFYKLMRGIVEDLQREIQRQNDKYEQHLLSLTEVKQKIWELLANLAQDNKVQATEFRKMTDSSNKLSENINSLSLNVNSLSSKAGIASDYVSVLQQNVQLLEKGTQELLSRTSNSIDPLGGIIRDFSGAVKQLQIEVIGFKASLQRLDPLRDIIDDLSQAVKRFQQDVLGAKRVFWRSGARPKEMIARPIKTDEKSRSWLAKLLFWRKVS